MSGTTYDSECPKCGDSMMSSSDWKPYDCVSHECPYCGFYAWTCEDRLTLEELNDLRKDLKLRSLKKLPVWEKE